MKIPSGGSKYLKDLAQPTPIFKRGVLQSLSWLKPIEIERDYHGTSITCGVYGAKIEREPMKPAEQLRIVPSHSSCIAFPVLGESRNSKGFFPKPMDGCFQTNRINTFTIGRRRHFSLCAHILASHIVAARLRFTR